MSLTSFVHRATTVLCMILHRPHRRLLDGVPLVPFDRLSRMPRCQRSAVWSAHRNRLQCTFTQRFVATEVSRIHALNRLPGQRDASPWVRQVHRHPVCSASSSTHTYAGSVQRCRSHVRADRADRARLSMAICRISRGSNGGRLGIFGQLFAVFGEWSPCRTSHSAAASLWGGSLALAGVLAS
jgi:hypothetical protein